MGHAQVTQGVFGTKSSQEKSADSTSEASGANRPTIGSTTISTSEAEAIRNEVKSTLHTVFPGIHLSTAQAGSPNMESITKESGNTSTSVIDLARSLSRFAPLAIAG